MKELSINSKNRVLLVTCIYPDTKDRHVGTFVANWAEQLKAADLDVMVYKRDHLTLGSYINFKRVWKYYIESRFSKYDWHGIRVYRQGIHLTLPLNYNKNAPQLTYRKIKPIVAEIYKKFPFDLIYLATWGDFSLAMSWIAAEMKIPCISSAIGDHTTLYYDKPNSLHYKLEREIYIRSKLVICVSKDIARKVDVMTAGNAKPFVFYSGVDVKKFKPSSGLRKIFRNRLGFSQNDIVLIYVGRVTKEKGVYELLESYARIVKRFSNLKLLLVGPVFGRSKLNKLLARLGIANKIKLVCGVGHGEIPGYMNAADIFVFPSWMEGLPNVVMEASACELPVIATKVGGIPELIDDEVSGFLVSPCSVESLSEKLNYVLLNKDKAREVGKVGRIKMFREFNYYLNGEIIVNQIKNIIEAQEQLLK